MLGRVGMAIGHYTLAIINRQNDNNLRLKNPKSGSFCPLKYLRFRLGGLTPDIHNSFLKCAQQTTGTLLGVIKCDIEQTRIEQEILYNVYKATSHPKFIVDLAQEFINTFLNFS